MSGSTWVSSGARTALTIAPTWAAYKQYRQERGDPIPVTFARHASAHAVSSEQYHPVNATATTGLAGSEIADGIEVNAEADEPLTRALVRWGGATGDTFDAGQIEAEQLPSKL